MTLTPSHEGKLKIGDIEVTALHTPCHTQDSICFYVEDKKTGQRGVFTGYVLSCSVFVIGIANVTVTRSSSLAAVASSKVSLVDWGIS